MTPPEVEELIQAAYRVREFRIHPLGFFYLKDSVGEGLARRIHVWLADSPVMATNHLHLHSFEIKSVVVVGKLRNELFRYRETVEGVFIEFEVSYEEGKSILRRTGRFGELDGIGSFETVAGARYHLEAGVLHRVTVNAAPCVTVSFTIERGVRICSYGLTEEEQPFVRRLVTREEADQIAAALDNVLHP